MSVAYISPADLHYAMEAPIDLAAAKRDAAIKAAQDKAWAERQRIMMECQQAIDVAWKEYRAAAWRGLYAINGGRK